MLHPSNCVCVSEREREREREREGQKKIRKALITLRLVLINV
jgi:hypothetical protein